MRISGGFAAALFGIGMTILSWYGPWEWPAWPALAVLHLVFGNGFDDLPNNGRAAVVVALIVVNVSVWGAAAYGIAATYLALIRRDGPAGSRRSEKLRRHAVIDELLRRQPQKRRKKLPIR
jgi:hypothetical protein